MGILSVGPSVDVAYALFRDGLDFVHLVVNVRTDDSSALTELPSFKAYAKDVTERRRK